MIDFGFSQLILVAIVALIVIGPQKLPIVARIVGNFIGKTQRYLNDVKAQVQRSIEIDELKRIKHNIDNAGLNIQKNIVSINQHLNIDKYQTDIEPEVTLESFPIYNRPDKNWRLKSHYLPQQYRQSAGVRVKILSGAARVAKYRPLSL
jgi:sec-independent protein translocase protein TatB